MKFVVLSDTHGDISAAANVLDNLKNEVDGVIHLGDMDNDAIRLENRYKDLVFYYIKGNNEFGSFSPAERLIILEGFRVFMTHGHKYRVYFDLLRLYYAAEEREADVVLFGHTHSSFCKRDGRILFLNPGSISFPRSGKYKTFAILDINEDRLPKAAVYNYMGRDNFEPKKI